jgi:phospholipase/carboxylesterase
MSIAHGERTVHAGEPLRSARAAMILLHGRGATAEDILTIASEIQQQDWAYVAPQAAGSAWYPNPFTAPLERNEPYLSAALDTVSKLFTQISETVPAERIVVLGFSQGGCLALEWSARRAQHLGGVVGLSAGLIGPDGTPRDYPGNFAGAPAFLGCSDMDPYIAKSRVEEAADVYRRLGADVTLKLYPGMPHTVSGDEIAEVRRLVEAV